MNWLREAISDSKSGVASAKRLSMLLATFALAVSTVVLAAASLLGHDVAPALAAVTVPLAGLGGYSYVGGKYAERKHADTTSSMLIQKITTQEGQNGPA